VSLSCAELLIAIARSQDSTASELSSERQVAAPGQFDQRTIGQWIASDQRGDGTLPLVTEEADPNLVSARNDVVVRQEFGAGADEKSGAVRTLHLRRRPERSLEKAAEEIVAAHGGS
jgi:hypothetical protein